MTATGDAEKKDSCLTPTHYLILAVLVSCFGSTFVFGYCISVLNTPRQKIECFFLETWISDFTLSNSTMDRQEFLKQCTHAEQLSDLLSPRDDTKLRWMYTMTQVVWVACAATGSFLTALVADNFGRRTGLAFSNGLSVLAALAIIPALPAKSPVFIYITRALSGLHNGLVIPMQSMYVMEIAPIALRGVIGCSGQLSITVGILFGGFVGLEQMLNRETFWAVAIGLAGIPSLISSILLIFLPESPRFLYLNRGDEQAAKVAVEIFCPPEEVASAMTELKEEKARMDKQETEEKFTIGTLFTSRRYRMALILALTMGVVQQLSGINVVMQYSSVMLENTGVKKSVVPLVILGLYAVNVLATIVSMPALENFGRRSLFLLSLLISLIALVSLLIVSQFTPKTYSTATTAQKAFSAVACVFVFIYVVGFAIGLGSVTVMYISEIFQQQARGAANSVVCGVTQVTNTLVLLTYYVLEKSMGHFVYLIYIVPVAAAMIFLYFFMPETKSRGVDDIADELSAKMGGPVSKDSGGVVNATGTAAAVPAAAVAVSTAAAPASTDAPAVKENV